MKLVEIPPHCRHLLHVFSAETQLPRHGNRFSRHSVVLGYEVIRSRSVTKRLVHRKISSVAVASISVTVAEGPPCLCVDRKPQSTPRRRPLLKTDFRFFWKEERKRPLTRVFLVCFWILKCLKKYNLSNFFSSLFLPLRFQTCRPERQGRCRKPATPKGWLAWAAEG